MCGGNTVSDFAFPVGTGNGPPVEQGTLTALPIYSGGTPHYFEPVPRCYLCDTATNLQAITVGKRAGKHICGGCLDGALRSVDK